MSEGSPEIDKFLEAIKNLASLDGKDIRSAFFPDTIKISKTKEEAQSRAKYEDYLKTGQSEVAQKTIEEHCQNFIKDMLDKGR